jgi:GTPase Era involved in 16S rRNA processing
METVQSMQEFWLKEVESVLGRTPIVLVGNKVDIAKTDSMAATVLESLGQKHCHPVFLTSAKTGDNVEALFAALGEQMVAEVAASPTRVEDTAPKKLAEVVDFIIEDFCAQYGDLEKAMLIVQHQFEEAGVDIRKPHKEAVLQALEGLARAEELSLTKTVAQVNLEERQKLVVIAKG